MTTLNDGKCVGCGAPERDCDCEDNMDIKKDMDLETLATQLNGEVCHTGGGIYAVVISRGRWTLTIGLAQPNYGFIETDKDGWDFAFDDEYVDSEYFENMTDFNGSNYAEVIEAYCVNLNDDLSLKQMGFRDDFKRLN